MELLGSIVGFLGSYFTDFDGRTYWGFLLTAIMLAFFVYTRQVKSDWSIKGFAQYAFPKNIWLHRSSLVDYRYFAVNAIIMLLFFAPLTALAYPKVLAGFLAIFTTISFPSVTTPPVGAGLLYFVIFIFMTDFMIFLSHYLSHKVPFLWQFHKVHHAAEVLNPMTLYRQHPVDLILTGILVGAGTALVHAVFVHVFSAPFSIFTMGALNVVVLVFYLMGYNLRHSHVRMSFGPLLDRWLISPIQHQLHHSSIEKHFDKNMGLIFAVWDRWFKTHYIPEIDEHIELGLPNNEAIEFDSAYKCYILPFKKAFKRYKVATAFVAVSLVSVGATSVAGSAFAPPSLHLEDLTWTEVDEARRSGYTSVIIPTGGTEQNGRHVILGKHNHVIKYTSEEIAKHLGHTLVAPVMTYVPEGSISPKSGHMKYSGTISIREEAFEMILEDTAKSLYAHGFTDIYILGDSGDSVKAQARAAHKISEDLEPGQTILHVTDYYQNHGQVDWLKSKGYTQDAIGYHAGIRDTSELLAVEPRGVRLQGLRQTSQDKGANGAYWKASPEIGEAMLELKIKAAVNQVKIFKAPKVAANTDNFQP